MYISPVAFCSARICFGAGPHPCSSSSSLITWTISYRGSSSLGEPAGRRGQASLDTRSSSLRRCFTPYLTLMMQCSRSCGVRWLIEEWRMHFLDSRGLSHVREAMGGRSGCLACGAGGLEKGGQACSASSQRWQRTALPQILHQSCDTGFWFQ